jgi:hypothetical protein
MLNEKQDDFAFELSVALGKIETVLDEQYHSGTCMFPDEIRWVLTDEGKEELVEDLESNWQPISLYPISGDEDYIRELINKVDYIRNDIDYLEFRSLYSTTLDRLYSVRSNFNENLEKVNEILKHIYTADAVAKISQSLKTLQGLYDILNNSIINPVLRLETDIVKIQQSFNYSGSNLPEKFIPAIQTIKENLSAVYADMAIAYHATKNMPSEDDLQGKVYSDVFFATYSNARNTILGAMQTSATVCTDITIINERLDHLVEGEGSVFDFAGSLLNASYDEIMISFKNKASELEPLIASAKKELQRLEVEREEKNDNTVDIGIETLTLLVTQLNTVTQMAEKNSYAYLNALEALKSNLTVASKELLDQGII